MKKGRWILVTLISAAMITAVGLACSERGQFILGGAFVNIGYRLQDRLKFHAMPDHDLTPEHVWRELVAHNAMASSVRAQFPRTPRHPVMVVVACMDARIHTEELVGDTRGYYYVIRTAGSFIHDAEMEMLELAVSNGVKVVAFTNHTDCAAEKVAKDPEKSREFPALSLGVRERQQRFQQFLRRPLISEKVRRGELQVKWLQLETKNTLLSPREAP